MTVLPIIASPIRKKTMKVLVTGGAGYIGSHTCKELALNGIEPVTVDNLIYGHRNAVKWGPFYETDIRNTKKLTDIIRLEKVEAVLHFAAFAYVGESVREPLKYYNNNLSGSISVLQAMQDAEVSHFVFSSTCATYGVPEKTPLTEQTPQNPINPYGTSKLLVEKVLQDHCKASDFKAIALRYFNAAGADPEGEIGERHDPETHLLPLAIRAALNQNDSMQIFGTDYPTPDGTCIRDYIHVKDLAAAHVKALQNLKQSPQPFAAYNLGIGRGYSVQEVLATTEKVIGKKVKSTVSERRPGDPPILLADASLARKELGWTPKLTELSTMIQTAYEWEKKASQK